jgi:predicted acyl esterase
MTGADDRPEEFRPPTALESAVRALGADTIRYRDGFEQPAKLVPGEIHRVRIVGITTANYFPAGHRIRIEIAGSNFPLADRNWHAGDRNDLATDGPVAHLTLHHGKGHESALHFRAYTGEITINTPMSDTRSGSRP